MNSYANCILRRCQFPVSAFLVAASAFLVGWYSHSFEISQFKQIPVPANATFFKPDGYELSMPFIAQSLGTFETGQRIDVLTGANGETQPIILDAVFSKSSGNLCQIAVPIGTGYILNRAVESNSSLSLRLTASPFPFVPKPKMFVDAK